MKSNLTIKQKLFAFSLLALSFVVTVASSGYVGNRELSTSLGDITTNFSALKNHLSADMMHDAIRADVLSALYAGEVGNQEMLRDAEASMQDHANELRENLGKNAALDLDPHIKKALIQIKPTLDKYVASAHDIIALAGKNRVAADAQLPAFRASFSALETDMAALSELIKTNTDRSQQSGEMVATDSQKLLTISTIISCAALLIISYFLSKGIITRLNEFSQHVNEIAQQGNLAAVIPATGHDEITQVVRTFNHFTAKLRDTMLQFNQAAQTMVTSSNTLSTQATQAKLNASSQSDHVIQTSSVMGQMSTSVTSVAANGQATVDAATKTSAIVQVGRENIKKSIEITQKMMTTVHSSAIQIDELSKLVQKIGEVANVIKSIADQTNLLALNAAIEAARAGEQGRGFAVVADDVRTLATRTAASTADISQMIALIKDATNASVTSMGRVATEAASGLTYVQKTHETLEAIILSTNSVTEQSLDIATATKEQSKAVKNVARNMDELASNMEEHMRTFHSVDNTADSLKKNAQELFRVIGQFKLAIR